VSAATEPLAREIGVSAPAVPMRQTVLRILRASTVYGLANLGIRALNFLLLPVYTRFLSPADYGLIALAETLAAFFAAITGMGFDASLQRLYFRHVADSGKLRNYIGTVLKFALLVQSAFLLLVLTVGPHFEHAIRPTSPLPFRYFALAMVTALATQFFNYRMVLFQAERRPWAYATLSFVSFTLTALVCVTMVVVARRGAVGMLTGKLIAAGICYCVAATLAAPSLASRFQWAYVRETVSMGLPLVPHMLMALGLITADRFILAHYRDLREVGLYTVAYTFGMIMSLVTMSLNQAWAPVYYDVARQGESGARVLGRMCDGLVIALTAIACFGSLVAQPFIRLFLDPRYISAGRVVPWIVGAYLAHSMFSLFSLACMQARRTNLIMIASFVGLAVNTILNFVLIPQWGMYGAAAATLIGYALEALVMYLWAQRAYRLRYDLPRLLAAMAIFVGVLVLTQVRWSPQHIANFTIAAGLASFLLLGLLGRHSLQQFIANRKPGGELR
jgi:O-antigen/teichoic acid export membrane protein